jgi:hypothetical protein
MKSKRHIKSNNKTLKQKINKYVCKKKDICCDNEFDRNLVIEDIFTLYREIAEDSFEKDEYLSFITNDFVKFIGYKNDLQINKDKEGVKLWENLNIKINNNEKSSKMKIIKVLNEVPLYYLLSFLGSAYYTHKRQKDSIKN